MAPLPYRAGTGDRGGRGGPAVEPSQTEGGLDVDRSLLIGVIPARGATMIDAYADVVAAAGWAGARAVDPDGRKVGDVVGLLVDRQLGRPRWLLVNVGRSRGHRCVPLRDTIGRADRVHVPLTSRTVRDSPTVPSDGALSARIEHEVCRYYRLPGSRLAPPPTWDRRRTTALATRAADGTLTWSPGPREPHTPTEPAPHARPPLAMPAYAAPSAGFGDVFRPAPPVSTSRRVMVVEADPVAVVRLAGAIEGQPGFAVRAVLRDGPPALTAARTTRPDVVVAALQLPLLGGLELRSRLHAEDPRVHTVLVDHATTSTYQRLDARTVLVSADADAGPVLRALSELAAAARR